MEERARNLRTSWYDTRSSTITWVIPSLHSLTQSAPNSMAFLIRNRRTGDMSSFGMKTITTLANGGACRGATYITEGHALENLLIFWSYRERRASLPFLTWIWCGSGGNIADRSFGNVRSFFSRLFVTA